MAQPLSQIIDSLEVVNLKTWNAQEGIYKIRKMTLEEFKNHFNSEEGIKEIYEYIHKSCNLNMQRNALMDNFDIELVNLIQAAIRGEDLEQLGYIKRKHKTY